MSTIVDHYATKIFGTSWRTTAAGVASLLAGLAGSINDLLSGHMPSTPNMTLIGLGWVGIHSRDQKAPPVAPA